MKQTGTVIKGLGGLYDVRLDGGGTAVCRGKGILKKDDGKLLVGDRVEITVDESGKGETVIEAILTRKNALIRPPLANVTVMVLTASAVSPLPSLENIDRLLAVCEYLGVTPFFAVTKTDLDEKAAKDLASLYERAGYPAFLLDSLTGEGTDTLKSALAQALKDGGIAAFAGASGVGKSTLLTALFPELALATGSISEKTRRGKHTTRSVELFPYEGGYVADTPGFSLLDFERFDFLPFEALASSFRDFAPYVGECRYDDCTHLKEEGCAVLGAVREGKLAASRHESYKALYPILKAKASYEARKNVREKKND